MYRAQLSEDWEIWGPNGGYLASVALRAAGREARIPRPVAISAHYLRVGAFGAVDVLVEVLQRGRRSESLRVSVRQNGRALLEALVRTAAEGPGLAHRFGEAPAAPAPETLPTPQDLTRERRYSRFWDNFEVRVCQPERFTAEAARDPLWREWYRYRPAATFDDPFVEAARSLVLVDTLTWPAACQPHPESGFQAPSLDVTAWFHEPPDSEWLLADHVSPVGGSGLLGTLGRVWSRDGRLVASGGSQLLCVPAPPASG